MDDPRPVHFTHRGHFWIVDQQAIDQSPVFMSCTGMNDEADRFVYNNNVGVFIHNNELHRWVSSRPRIRRSREYCFDCVASLDTSRAGSGNHSINSHSPLINHPSSYGATHFSHQRHDSIKPFIGQRCGDLF